MRTIKKLDVVPFIFLLCLFAACDGTHSVKKDLSQLPDSTLIAIREGYKKRVADIFNAQKGKILGETFRVNWIESLAHSYPRTAYAAVQFWFNQNIDSANIVLKEYGQYFIDKPDKTG